MKKKLKCAGLLMSVLSFVSFAFTHILDIFFMEYLCEQTKQSSALEFQYNQNIPYCLR